MALCPICGRTIGTYTNDPLLTTPSLSTVQYRGYVHLISTHIKELQDERKGQEFDAGVSPLTEFSLIDDTRLFQNIRQYILELRSSTEKILAMTGMSLDEFLSQDENGDVITAKSIWTDANIEEDSLYQCKAIHIEDLRHFLPIERIRFLETWTDHSPIWQTSDDKSIIQPLWPDPLIQPPDNQYDHFIENHFVNADHEWTGNYIFQVHTLNYGDSIQGNSNLNLSGGNLSYSSVFTLRAFDSRFPRYRGSLDFIDNALAGIDVTNKTKLSWTGSFAGSISQNNVAFLWGSVYLQYFNGADYITYNIIFVKYGTGSKSAFDQGPNSRVIPITDWGSEINIKAALTAAGIDTSMGGGIIGLSFEFHNEFFDYVGMPDPLNFTASLVASIDDLKIKG